MLNMQSVPAAHDRSASTIDINIDEGQHMVMLTARKQIVNECIKRKHQRCNQHFYTRSRMTSLIGHTVATRAQSCWLSDTSERRRRRHAASADLCAESSQSIQHAGLSLREAIKLSMDKLNSLDFLINVVARMD